MRCDYLMRDLSLDFQALDEALDDEGAASRGKRHLQYLKVMLLRCRYDLEEMSQNPAVRENLLRVDELLIGPVEGLSRYLDCLATGLPPQIGPSLARRLVRMTEREVSRLVREVPALARRSMFYIVK